MEIDVLRKWLSPASTIGELRIDGAFLCFTLEDMYRGDDPAAKVPGQTAIPCGRYLITIERSPRLSQLYGRDYFTPRLHDVPGFQGILMHPGNKADDTDGCVLVGMERGPDVILRSVEAFGLLMPRVQAAQGPIWCNVKLAGDALVC
jgi:hypothetical protein